MEGGEEAARRGSSRHRVVSVPSGGASVRWCQGTIEGRRDRDDVAQGAGARDVATTKWCRRCPWRRPTGERSQLVVSAAPVEADRARERWHRRWCRCARPGARARHDETHRRGMENVCSAFPGTALDDVADREVGVEARVDAAGEHTFVSSCASSATRAWRRPSVGTASAVVDATRTVATRRVRRAAWAHAP